MRFSRLDSAISLAKKTSDKLVQIDSRLQSFVVGYLIVDIISEFELRIAEMVKMRARKLGDVPNANFVAKMIERKFRSPDVNKINNILKDHDETLLTTFKKKLDGSKWVFSMGNLMLARHYHVHKGGSPTMSLQDVERDYNEAVKLFDALAHALGLTEEDCAHLT